MERGKKTTTKPAAGHLFATAKYKVINSGIFVIVASEMGVTLTWDKGTRMYVTLDPKYKGIK